MIAKIPLAALLTISASAAATQKCLTSEEILAAAPDGFALRNNRHPATILTGNGLIDAADLVSTDNPFWSIDEDGQLYGDGGYLFGGTAENFWKTSVAELPIAKRDAVASPVKCCVKAFGQPIACKGQGLGKNPTAWINTDGTLSIGPLNQKPVKTKTEQFVVKKQLPFEIPTGGI